MRGRLLGSTWRNKKGIRKCVFRRDNRQAYISSRPVSIPASLRPLRNRVPAVVDPVASGAAINTGSLRREI